MLSGRKGLSKAELLLDNKKDIKKNNKNKILFMPQKNPFKNDPTVPLSCSI